MNTSPFSRITLAGVVVSLGLAGCSSVSTGPGLPPPAEAPAVIRGVEPEPAPIPQKDVPAGQSSLRKTAPDTPVAPPPPKS